MSNMQRTVVLVKPDGLQRGLVGEIMHRFERKGLKLIAIKMVSFDGGIAENWYEHIKDRDFFPRVKKFMVSSPIVAMVWEGLEAIAAVRKIVGITTAREAEAGSIRGDFGMSKQNNLVHASDGAETAERELKILFKDEELFDYESGIECLVYSTDDK